MKGGFAFGERLPQGVLLDREWVMRRPFAENGINGPTCGRANPNWSLMFGAVKKHPKGALSSDHTLREIGFDVCVTPVPGDFGWIVLLFTKWRTGLLRITCPYQG